MLLIRLLPPLLAVAAPIVYVTLNKCMEIQLRSQVDADVQQIFDNLHSLKDQPKLTTALSLDKKGEI